MFSPVISYFCWEKGRAIFFVLKFINGVVNLEMVWTSLEATTSLLNGYFYGEDCTTGDFMRFKSFWSDFKEFIEKSLPWRLYKFLYGLFFHSRFFYVFPCEQYLLWWYTGMHLEILKINNFNPSECLIQWKVLQCLARYRKTNRMLPMPSRNFQLISIIKYWNCALEDTHSFIYSRNNHLINMHKALCLDAEDTRQIQILLS